MSGASLPNAEDQPERVMRRPPVARPRQPFVLRRWLAFAGRMPSPATIWLLGFMALFLIRPWEVMVPALEPIRLETLAVLVLLLRMGLGNDARLRFDRPTLPILAFLVAVLVTSLTSWDPGSSYEKLESVAKVSLFAICVIAALRSPADLRAFCLGWVVIMILYESKSLWEYFLNGRGQWRMGFFRLIGIEDSFGDPNTFAGKIVVLIPFLVLLYTTTRIPRERKLLIVGFVLSGMVIVLTGSRGAMLGTVFAGLLYLGFSRRRVAAIGVVAAISVVGVLLMPPEIRERYITLVEPETNESATISAQGRWVGFKKGLYLFSQRPLVGIGPAVFPVSHEHMDPLPYEVVGLQPHNMIGQLMGEMGLLGAFAFGAMLTAIYSAAWRLHRIDPRRGREAHFLSRLGSAIAYSATLLLFLGIGGHNTYSYNWLWLAGLAGAATTVISGRLKKTPSADPTTPSPRPAGGTLGSLGTTKAHPAS